MRRMSNAKIDKIRIRPEQTLSRRAELVEAEAEVVVEGWFSSNIAFRLRFSISAQRDHVK